MVLIPIKNAFVERRTWETRKTTAKETCDPEWEEWLEFPAGEKPASTLSVCVKDQGEGDSDRWGKSVEFEFKS
ncbi:unnamed protein product [Darwinula stevensoni]|uniref:C2 domain-containing protein n=1 Tax=Darwinula stevensoni TaxID=69355 RepID=A0A7R9AGI7_9CRUS|nr:unnamed protein product [Darwinula stevensoni]CAG0903945.1 unnamed protein product [Darwinula stevensoni]